MVDSSGLSRSGASESKTSYCSYLWRKRQREKTGWVFTRITFTNCSPIFPPGTVPCKSQTPIEVLNSRRFYRGLSNNKPSFFCHKIQKPRFYQASEATLQHNLIRHFPSLLEKPLLFPECCVVPSLVWAPASPLEISDGGRAANWEQGLKN